MLRGGLRGGVRGAEHVVGLPQAQLQVGDGSVAVARLAGAQRVGAPVAAELGGVGERGQGRLHVGARLRVALPGAGHQQQRLVELAGHADGAVGQRVAGLPQGDVDAGQRGAGGLEQQARHVRVGALAVEPLRQPLRGGQGAGALAGVLPRLFEGQHAADHRGVLAPQQGRAHERQRRDEAEGRSGDREVLVDAHGDGPGGRRGGEREAGERQRRGEGGPDRHAATCHEQGDGQRKRGACSCHERCRDKCAGEVRH